MPMHELPILALREMLDVKGIGLVPPTPPISQPYLTLAFVHTVYEALAEFMWAPVVQHILDKSGSHVRALPHYAVIDLGVDVIVYPNTTWHSPAKGTDNRQRTQLSCLKQ